MLTTHLMASIIVKHEYCNRGNGGPVGSVYNELLSNVVKMLF